VTVKNDTTFQVKYSATYKGGGLTKDTVVGNFTATFRFYKEDKPKISVSFIKDETAWSQGALGDFNIVWVLLPTKAYLKINETSAIDYTAYTSMVKIKETTAKEDKKCEIGDSADPSAWTGSWSLTFWDDVDGASVLYAGLDKVFGSKGITVVFPVNNGQVDPSVVGTSTLNVATYYPFQRKSFYANGRFWVFWSDGTNMVYATSTDGSTWTSPTTVRACSNGNYFSVWFDGTYLHYAYAYSSSIFYRRGTPNSDGTITWSAAEQTVSTTYNSASYPMISVDTNGYVWIGYRDGSYYPYVIKSGNNDGTWGTTPSGFPYQLSTTSDSYWRVSVIPLTSGKMLAVYAYSVTVKARKWDGSAWGTEVATTSAIYYGHYYSAVAQGDDVHLVFLKSTGYDILYVKYTYATNSFGTETTLQAGATSISAPVLSIDPSTNDLYVFAATKTTGTPSGWTANHIYYIKYTASSGTWGSWTDWIDESTEVLYDSDRLTCFYQAYGSKIGLEYMTKTASPYNVKFAYLSLAVADTTPPTYSNVGTNTTQAGQPCQFSVFWNDNVNVSGFIFGTNNTGTWVNDTWVSFTVFYNSTAAWSNVTKTLNSTVGVRVEWQIWTNDTSNNWNNTGIQYLITTGQTYTVDTTFQTTPTWTLLIQATFNTAPTWNLQESFAVVIQSAFNVQPQWTLSESWNILTASVFNILSSWTSTTTWTTLTTSLFNILPQWNLAQTWTVLSTLTFNVVNSWTSNLQWTLEVLKFTGAQFYTVDLTWLTQTTWETLTTNTFNVVNTWSLNPTWTVLTQTTYNVLSSWLTSATWTLDVYHWISTGITYYVDLTWQTAIEWFTETQNLPPSGTPWTPPTPPITPPTTPPVTPVLPPTVSPTLLLGIIVAAVAVAAVVAEKRKAPPESRRKVVSTWNRKLQSVSKFSGWKPRKLEPLKWKKKRKRFRTLEE
jgi:hypothetical protein